MISEANLVSSISTKIKIARVPNLRLARSPFGAPLTAPQVTTGIYTARKTSIRRTEYAENRQNGGVLRVDRVASRRS